MQYLGSRCSHRRNLNLCTFYAERNNCLRRKLKTEEIKQSCIQLSAICLSAILVFAGIRARERDEEKRWRAKLTHRCKQNDCFFFPMQTGGLYIGQIDPICIQTAGPPACSICRLFNSQIFMMREVGRLSNSPLGSSLERSGTESKGKCTRFSPLDKSN